MGKFLPLDVFEAPLASGYQILPNRFGQLDEDRYVLTNLVGEYILASRSGLERYLTHKLSPTEDLYEDLKSKHFLVDKDSQIGVSLLALKYRTKLARLAEFTGLHMFVASLRCEHSCPYCQVSRQSEDKGRYDMTRETADSALELVFRSPSRAIKIEFQGGEPLLNFPIIKHTVERANAINLAEKRNLTFVIATNLALIDDDVLEFCRLHDVSISTSLDGPRELHNRNRPRPGNNSHERAVEGIERVRKALGRDRVSALMTTTEASLSQPIEIIDEYIRRGFHEIFLRPLSPYGFAVKTKWYESYGTQRWLDFYFKGLDYVIELNKRGFFFVEIYAATILAKILTPFEPGYVDLLSPSGIGVGAVVYNYDGDVYASDEGRMLAEMGKPAFKLGNVIENSYDEIFLSDNLLDPIEASFCGSVPMCSDCAFVNYCGADPVFHFATHGDYVGHKPTSDFCNRNMAIFKRLIGYLEDPNVKRIFLSWMRQ